MTNEASTPRTLRGRYALYDPIASGGMAHVHFGRLLGTAGFSRIVAIKRLRGELLESAELVSTLIDEARLASRIRHANVVATLDMVRADDELFLVMEYVPGESLSHLLTRCQEQSRTVEVPIAAGILVGVLYALHAAHQATDERGEPMGIVHRDVSPQNVLVGTDGLARLLDFGIAKGKGRLQTTRAGQLKGKVSYMAPEQILGEEPDRRSDVYAAGVVLWEVLTRQRMFPGGDTPAENFAAIPKILEADVDPPSQVDPGLPRALDAIIMRALNRERDMRYPTARDLAVALEDAVPIASSRRIGEWVEQVAARELTERALQLEVLERAAQDSPADARDVVDDTVSRRRRKRLESAEDGREQPAFRGGAVGTTRLAGSTDVRAAREALDAAGFRALETEEHVRAPANGAGLGSREPRGRFADREEDETTEVVRRTLQSRHDEDVTERDMRRAGSEARVVAEEAPSGIARVREAVRRGTIQHEASDADAAEVRTDVYQRARELDGPREPPEETTQERAEVAVLSYARATPKLHSRTEDDLRVPVRSNTWLLVVVAVLLFIAGGVLALLRLR